MGRRRRFSASVRLGVRKVKEAEDRARKFAVEAKGSASRQKLNNNKNKLKSNEDSLLAAYNVSFSVN